ncbi:uncharacterized protein BJ212DRAFT_1476678 [Suillus subaureus]|uniref:Uncharacterized protein n=1 Tax=Suillus subaureus TaxID=48587 RepID=A0A9P7JIE6_9AGAM|nr:uncharacterized protein BJ212DRAFT_1476678 [Suillus subaureus]KAG1823816.1 hypothetical protein BJ212DRAFT_1476678 [Suillus subaureus]
MPMPDLHAMAITIQDEQDGKIDTLQCLREGLRHKIVDQYPSFQIPDPPANAPSLLLDQSVPASMSPPESALPPFIDLLVAGMVPTPPKFEDASVFGCHYIAC